MTYICNTVSVLILSIILSCNAFAPNIISCEKGSHRSNHPMSLHMIQPINELSESIESCTTTIANNLDYLSSSLLLSEITSEKLADVGKAAVITLLFGGGLIPAAIDANKSLIGTLRGKRRGGEEGSTAEYIEDSGASGPELSGSALLFASEKIPLVDIIAIMSRIQDETSIADWNNLPKDKIANPNWLPRSMYKENIRKARFISWPIDKKTGEPVGGKDLEASEKSRISKPNVEIGDAALDAVFDSWAWGASIATSDKVAATLKLYRDGETFDVDGFLGAGVRGRSVTGFAALSFIIIQIIAYSSLFIAPLLRVFFNLDIGFGKMGDCDGMCNTLF